MTRFDTTSRAASRLVLAASLLIGASGITLASQRHMLRSGTPAVHESFENTPDNMIDREANAAHRTAATPLLNDRYSIEDPDAAEVDAQVSPKSTRAVEIARQFRGTRYVWGGTTSRGFDCSGFVRYVYSRLGRYLPRTASEQFHVGAPVTRAELKPGDVLFFHTSHRGVSHVGIYVGNNNFIHAANPHKGVTISSLDGYYARRLVGARRFNS